jgi:hypothetical protein
MKINIEELKNIIKKDSGNGYLYVGRLTNCKDVIKIGYSKSCLKSYGRQYVGRSGQDWEFIAVVKNVNRAFEKKIHNLLNDFCRTTPGGIKCPEWFSGEGVLDFVNLLINNGFHYNENESYPKIKIQNSVIRGNNAGIIPADTDRKINFIQNLIIKFPNDVKKQYKAFYEEYGESKQTFHSWKKTINGETVRGKMIKESMIRKHELRKKLANI